MLAEALVQQYPGIQIGPDSTDECVIANGKIIAWNRPELKPVEADVLAAFDQSVHDAELLAQAINEFAKAKIAEIVPTEHEARNQRRASRVIYELQKLPEGGTLAEPYASWEAGMVAIDNAIEGIVARSNTITTQAELDAWKAE